MLALLCNVSLRLAYHEGHEELTIEKIVLSS